MFLIRKIKNWPVVFFILLSFVVLLAFIFTKSLSGSKIVYADSAKLFENFNMTKELKGLGEKEFNVKKSNLDSIYRKLQSAKITASEKELLMQRFVQEKEDLNQFNDYFASEQSSKIWARIKSYSSEFSKENKYQLIIGSENKTNVLFADKEIDVTEDLLIYINKKYEGFR